MELYVVEVESCDNKYFTHSYEKGRTFTCLWNVNGPYGGTSLAFCKLSKAKMHDTMESAENTKKIGEKSFVGVTFGIRTLILQ